MSMNPVSYCIGFLAIAFFYSYPLKYIPFRKNKPKTSPAWAGKGHAWECDGFNRHWKCLLCLKWLFEIQPVSKLFGCNDLRKLSVFFPIISWCKISTSRSTSYRLCRWWCMGNEFQWGSYLRTWEHSCDCRCIQ